MKTLLLALLVVLFTGGEYLGAQQTNYANPNLLMEPEQLAKVNATRRFIILDARSSSSFEQGHIPGARWVDPVTWARAMTKGEAIEDWSNRLGLLGIDRLARLVVYDDNQAKDAVRIWWILRYLGIEDVRLLNGGWSGWKAINGPQDKGEAIVARVGCLLRPRPDRLATREQVLKSLTKGSLQIVDARSEKEFCGEKLTNKRGGAIPGAKLLEWSDLIDKSTQRFKSAPELQKLFDQAGIALDQPTVTHCQSGGRSSVMAFGLELMGAKNVSNYYLGWSEWGNLEDTPIVPGKLKGQKETKE